jgi:hypothetical protein
VLVEPSPKFHCREVGVPVDVSVNCTVWPTVGEFGLKLNDAAGPSSTVSVRVVVLEPVAFETVKVTVLEPAAAKMWLGFWAVLVEPSPKFHSQEVGLPVDTSVNWTAWPGTGLEGAKLNEAESKVMDATVSVRLPYLEPELQLAVMLTV